MFYTNFVLHVYTESNFVLHVLYIPVLGHFYPMCTLPVTAVSVLTVYPGDSAVQLSADIPSGLLAFTCTLVCTHHIIMVPHPFTNTWSSDEQELYTQCILY